MYSFHTNKFIAKTLHTEQKPMPMLALAHSPMLKSTHLFYHRVFWLNMSSQLFWNVQLLTFGSIYFISRFFSLFWILDECKQSSL